MVVFKMCTFISKIPQLRKSGIFVMTLFSVLNCAHTFLALNSGYLFDTQISAFSILWILCHERWSQVCSCSQTRERLQRHLLLLRPNFFCQASKQHLKYFVTVTEAFQREHYWKFLYGMATKNLVSRCLAGNSIIYT